MGDIFEIKSITQIHDLLGQSAPKHPLVSLIYLKDLPKQLGFEGVRFMSDLYMISLKDGISGSFMYGRNSYDYSEGTMVFTKPNQVIYGENEKIDDDSEGWMLFFHPDLIRKSELGKSIGSYSFFDYEVHEALHLSQEEQDIILDLALKIEREYNQNIDKHSQKLIISNIELLLNYCTRYYDRQFYIRTNLNQDHVTEFESFLKNYFNSEKPLEMGLPSVKYCGEALNMSPNYLSDLLKKETGKSAKDHISAFVINRAKNKLLGTTDSISEIAYNLGFEYPQHFSKLFKSKTGMSPAKYRSQN
ncbi:helix-turn-helix domain-containing protein [Tamlana sp. 2201CG12-4]|uniref:helix-turn-helix domain-containing protein n=1 Tax=Tamlana sp. 2201CG12-4 TaxID=3112582 RepID=UPI002DB5FA90|nr:helix-turn-helix domain-containing protein [Tamlana sp. 2201CG12-4]MEC3908133.1 helix-turn-helix domain-containing protein [Tamlana sp. 2201CG12-4]